jgi:VIT1/CCC1 family predicted Fe2+/Mn2+ transporter
MLNNASFLSISSLSADEELLETVSDDYFYNRFYSFLSFFFSFFFILKFYFLLMDEMKILIRLLILYLLSYLLTSFTSLSKFIFVNA